MHTPSSTLTHSTLVPIQPASHSTEPPFFCVTGVLGTAFELRLLGKQFGLNQPFYGLRSLGIHTEETLLHTLDAIVAHHIQSMQTIQPTGPYRLGGYSFGGGVAFEIAQQLHLQGHEISRLVILDSYTTAFAPTDLSQWDDAQFTAAFANLQQSNFSTNLDSSIALYRTLNATERLDHLYTRLRRAGNPFNRNDIQRMLAVYQANMLADHNYIPQRSDFPITLLRTDGEGPLGVLPAGTDPHRDPTWGWQALANQPIEVRRVPGNHFTMLRPPHIQTLAQQILACW